MTNTGAKAVDNDGVEAPTMASAEGVSTSSSRSIITSVWRRGRGVLGQHPNVVRREESRGRRQARSDGIFSGCYSHPVFLEPFPRLSPPRPVPCSPG